MVLTRISANGHWKKARECIAGMARRWDDSDCMAKAKDLHFPETAKKRAGEHR